MPADGISLPLKKAGTSARPAGATRRLGYINSATGRNASCPHMAFFGLTAMTRGGPLAAENRTSRGYRRRTDL